MSLGSSLTGWRPRLLLENFKLHGSFKFPSNCCGSKSGGKSRHHNIETGSLFGFLFFFFFETEAFSVTSHSELFAVIRGNGGAPKQESSFQPVAYRVALLLRSFPSLFPLLSLIPLLFCSPLERRGKKKKKNKKKNLH